MHFSNFIYLFVKYWKIESVEAIAADYGFDDRHWNNENKRCWTKSVKQDNWPRPKSFEFALKIFWGQGRRKIRLRKILRAHNLSRKELKVALRSCGSHKHIILGVPKDSPRIMHTLGDYKGPATRAWPRAPGLSLESHNWTNTTTQCLDTQRVSNALSFLSAVWVWFWFIRCLGRRPGAGVTRGARLQPAVLSISSPRTNPDIYHATNFSSNTCPTKLAHNRRRTEVARNFHIQLNKLYLSVCCPEILLWAEQRRGRACRRRAGKIQFVFVTQIWKYITNSCEGDQVKILQWLLTIEI